MIIYSVTININNSVVSEWLEWMMKIHIPEVMSTGLFVNYRFMKEIIPLPEGSETRFIINYELTDKESYDNYSRNFAPFLQRKHTEKFSGKFTANRTLMEVINI